MQNKMQDALETGRCMTFAQREMSQGIKLYTYVGITQPDCRMQQIVC